MAVKTKHLVSGYRVPGAPISLDEMKTFLWGAATRLRGQIDAAGYKEYIFPLLFFKRISDVYDEQYNGFLREGGEEYAGMQVEDLAIKIPQGAHWDDVREVTENVGQKLVEAFIAIEQANPGEEVDGRVVGGLEGIFGPKDGWTNKSKMPDSIITSLIEDFSRYDLSLESCPADAQEFYTNRTVVTLMAEILQPKPDESIYDPTCGSGGMLIKCLNYLRDKGQPWQGVKVFGQEINALTASIARMNLYLNGVEDFSIVREDTLSHPAFVDGSRLRKFDIVLANPPYSIKQWNRDAFAHDYWGRNMFGTPPQGRADYAFIQHIIASMDEKTGRCAILLPHGILGRLEEQEIREGLLETDLVDCVIGIGKNLFYNSPMEACIVICRSKKPLESKDNILFINAKHLVTRKNAESYLEPEHIAEIAACYHERKEIPGFSKVATRDEVKANKCYLSIGLYVERQGDDSGASIDNLVQDWDETAVSAANELSILTILIQQKYDC